MDQLNRISRFSRRQRGFTLVEMLIVLTIGGIVMAIAMPSFNNLVRNNRVKASVADLQASLFFARSEAMKRSANVDIVPTGGDWKNGWVVQISGGGAQLRNGSPLPSSLTIVQTPITTITYGRTGRLTAAVPDIVVSIAGSNVRARCLVLDLSGRPKVMVDTDGNPANGCT